MASNFAESYLSKLGSGKKFPTGTAFLMPGLGVISKAQPPTIDQVNESCALAFQDSLSQVVRMCENARANPKFVQLLFAQAFMVGTDLHCMCVIQWECEAAKKGPVSKTAVKTAKKPAPAKSKTPPKPKPRSKAKR